MPEQFRLADPLPQPKSVTFLEASAGTGKTFTISFLVARMVCEGYPLSKILAVTFSRKATNELRDTIRAKLQQFLASIQAKIAGQEVNDELINELLAADSQAELMAKAQRLADALAEIDTAPIFTLHAFASRMLVLLGLLADHEQGDLQIGDTTELVAELINDKQLSFVEWVSQYCAHLVSITPDEQRGKIINQLDSYFNAIQAEAFQSSRNTSGTYPPPLVDLGQKALTNIAAPIYPDYSHTNLRDALASYAHSGSPSLYQLKLMTSYHFCAQLREEFELKKRRYGLLTYDDMIGRLVAALDDPLTGQAAGEKLAELFPVALIDEFQDTDPAQWRFLSKAFIGRSMLFMIGDPKQAIYRFRGGDIESYLLASRPEQYAAANVQFNSYSLQTNYRSDEPVIRGIEEIFGPISFSPTKDQPISLTQAIAHNLGSRLSGPKADCAQVELRQLRLEPEDAKSLLRVKSAIANDLAIQLAGYLAGDYLLKTPSGSRRLAASDIAILVNTNAYGAKLAEQLRELGYPVVFTGNNTIYQTKEASDWLYVLRALSEPAAQNLSAAAMTSIFGWTLVDFCHTDATRSNELAQLRSQASRLLAKSGIAACFEHLAVATKLEQRVLAQENGEQIIVNLRHLVSLLNEAQTRYQLTPIALTEFLAEQIKDANAEDNQDSLRRLASSAPAIQIMTVHQSKGLQFPLVLLPEIGLSGVYTGKRRVSIRHRDNQRVLDINAWANSRSEADLLSDHVAEQAAENLRVCYVACTRAQSRLVLWQTDAQLAETSALNRLLANRGRQQIPPIKVAPLGSLAGVLNPAHVLVEDAKLAELLAAKIPVNPLPEAKPPKLGISQFVDHIDRDWVRTSYSGLTKDLHGEPTSFQLTNWQSDEVELSDSEHGVAQLADSPKSALASLVGGTQFGSLVHEILEKTDFSAADLPAEVLAKTEQIAGHYALGDLDLIALATGLTQVLNTNLGRLAASHTLASLGTPNRLAELDFELPMGGVTRHCLAKLAKLFTRHLAADDPLAGYGKILANSPASEQVLAGFLTGSIDVVLRLGDSERYLVLDYKTNRLPVAEDEELSAAHYHPAAMAEAMIGAHYPLQALIYCVALHRYLRWRLPDYQPTKNLAGVGYLFVRGMTGQDNPIFDDMPAGVFSWYPPAEMILAADEIIAGRQGHE